MPKSVQPIDFRPQAEAGNALYIVTIQEAVDVIVTIREAGPWLWLLDVS